MALCRWQGGGASLMLFLSRIWHHLSYANTVETAVLLVILYDIIWHRLNAIREIERDKEAETKRIQREEAAEKRQIRRERQEVIRKHWQELQSNLILLHRIKSVLAQQKQFIQQNNDSENHTTRHALMVMANGLPNLLSEFHDRWGRIVAQLNIFPESSDPLGLEILELVQGWEDAVKGEETEVKDETLFALATLIRRVAEAGRLPNLYD